MANIRDIAHRAGVSIATVSRILSQDPAFQASDETRARVWNIAQELQYTPGVRAARTQSTKIGCVLAVTSEKYADPFFSAILVAAETECTAHGATLTAVRDYNELSDPRVLNELCGSGLQGMILMEHLPPHILHPIEQAVPHIVTVDQQGYRFDDVGFDRTLASRQVMDCLLEHGYRRIAIIDGGAPGAPMEDSIRMMVYRDSLRRAQLSYDEALVCDCGWDFDVCAQQTRQLLESSAPPDAIFAGSDSLASVVLSTVYGMGLHCPRDVGVIGFNNIPLSAHMAPPLTTVDVPRTEIGKAAAQLLLERIRNGSAVLPRKLLFPTEIVMRSSLCKQGDTPL